MLTYKTLQAIKTGDNHVHIIDNNNNTMTTIVNCYSVVVDKTNVIIVRNENNSIKVKLHFAQHIEFTSSDGYDVKIMVYNNKLAVTVKQISPVYPAR